MSAAQLSEDEKARVRRHLGYPEVSTNVVYTAGLSTPTMALAMIESAMTRLSVEGVGRVRELLDVLDMLEKKMLKAACYVTVNRIGDIEMRPANGMQGTDLLEKEYIRWMKRLADCIGVAPHPFSSKVSGSSSMNVRVRH